MVNPTKFDVLDSIKFLKLKFEISLTQNQFITTRITKALKYKNSLATFKNYMKHHSSGKINSKSNEINENQI